MFLPHSEGISHCLLHFVLLVSFLPSACHSMWEILLVLTPFFFLNLPQFDYCMCRCILNLMYLCLFCLKTYAFSLFQKILSHYSSWNIPVVPKYVLVFSHDSHDFIFFPKSSPFKLLLHSCLINVQSTENSKKNHEFFHFVALSAVFL